MALLIEHSPHIATQFHPHLNAGVILETLAFSSRKKVWWLGDCGHSWEAAVGNRTSKNPTGCSICAGYTVLAGFNDLQTTHKALSQQWNYEKNSPLLPSEIIAGSHQKVHWIGTCQHPWEATVASRALNNRGCPYCTGQKVLAGFNDLSSVFPDIAKEWHPKNELMATEISAKSNRKVWWLGECGHEWDAVVNKRTLNGRGCPFCSGNKVLIGFNDLGTTHPQIVKDLISELNDGLTAFDISIGAKKMLKWKCPKGHLHEATPLEKSYYSNGCPVCSGRKVLKGFNDLESLRPGLAKEWNTSKNTLKPDEVSLGSNRPVWWKCPVGHEWRASTVRRYRQDTSCPLCSNLVSKAEQEIFDFIISLGLSAVQSDRKVLKGMELDIYIPEKKFAIEYNGLYWHSELRKKDNLYHQKKWSQALAEGVFLVQIWEDDWRSKPDVIKRMLRHKLTESTKLNKLYARNLKIEKIDRTTAKNFFLVNTTYNFIPEACYYGLLDQSGKLNALIGYLNNPQMEVEVRYISSETVVGGFSKLLNHIAKVTEAKTLVATSDNCTSLGGLYAKNGFTIEKTQSPAYRHVIFGKKVKLWDAGSILWKKEIG